MNVGYRKRFPKDKWIEMWIGISMDEIMRMKPARIWWQQNRWPLIEKKMSRDDHPRIDAEEHPEDYFTITADGFVCPLQNGNVGADEPIFHKFELD